VSSAMFSSVTERTSKVDSRRGSQDAAPATERLALGFVSAFPERRAMQFQEPAWASGIDEEPSS
jgi:hypothetical protein